MGRTIQTGHLGASCFWQSVHYSPANKETKRKDEPALVTVARCGRTRHVVGHPNSNQEGYLVK